MNRSTGFEGFISQWFLWVSMMIESSIEQHRRRNCQHHHHHHDCMRTAGLASGTSIRIQGTNRVMAGPTSCFFFLLSPHPGNELLTGKAQNLIGPVGFLIVPLFAYFLRNWKSLLMVISLPCLIYIALFWYGHFLLYPNFCLLFFRLWLW